uniref:Caspase recruitment domain family, member 14 n=1 Tax=Gasterosteus aculeatus aculeatus TaxID=481459 RepID=A0AAQ4PZC3_GASAC
NGGLCTSQSTMGDEELWELINDNRHRISLGVRPCILIPYLRQARVLTEMDEDEILSCHNLTNRSMRTSHMLDLLRTQGKNGAVALVESLMIHYPALYTQVTGRKPSTEPSRFSGLIKYSELTEYLVRAVTGMQKELQAARDEASKKSARCASLQSEIQQMKELSERSRCLQSENQHMRRLLGSLQHDITRLKDEKCDLYMRYTGAVEEKSSVNLRLHDLNLQLLEQKECLSLQVQQLTLDCNMHQKKITVIQNQMKELQAERDQAYLSRDEAQTMIARILAEKDTLRSQLVELQEQVCSMQAQRCPSKHLRRRSDLVRDHLNLTWFRINVTSSMCINLYVQCEDAGSVRSRNVEPPCPESLRRREEAFVGCRIATVADVRNPLSVPTRGIFPSFPHSSRSLCRTSVPPFLMRSRQKAIRVNGRVLSISLQGEALLQQLAVVGGNKTGVFVHQVTEGTAAHTVGIGPGAQIVEVKYEQNQKALRMVLEDSTLEEAMWALGQVTGLCHLSLRPRQDDYEALLQQLRSNETSSGDSFYVRVNLSLPAGPNWTLAVSCNDILHVTNTRPAGTKDSWYASQVHPCQLLDLQSGSLPNYYRAQRLLIRAIEDMTFQTKSSQKVRKRLNTESQPCAKSPHKCNIFLHILSYEGDTSAPRSCLTLMPYSLVTPHFPPVCRPVLLLPTILGHILSKKMADWQGFRLCEPEVLSSSEHAARLQRSEILEECDEGRSCCYTLQSVEKVMKTGTHCVLPLGLDCVRRLHRADIFPIIIFIGQSARSAKKLKSKLQRHSQSEEQLLACSRSEEPLLDKLPCLYHSVAQDSWCDQNSLLTHLRTIIWEEQKKIVWAEPDLW